MQIDQSAPAFARNGLHRAFNGRVAIASRRTEYIAHHAVGVHTDQHRLAAAVVIATYIAAHQRYMRLAAVHLALIGDQAELSVTSANHRFANPMHIALMLHAVAN